MLRTPAEARNALRYVLGNFASHAARRGERVPAAWIDPYTSAGALELQRGQRTFWPEPITRAAETWLLGRGALAPSREEIVPRPRWTAKTGQ